MKKFLRLFLLIILFTVGVNTVKAECEDLVPTWFDGNGGSLYDRHAFIFTNYYLRPTQGDDIKYDRWDFSPINGGIDSNGNATPDRNTIYAGYCRDAGLSSGFATTINGVPNPKRHSGYYKCVEELFDSETSEEAKKTYEAGVIAILKNGYSPLNSGSTNNFLSNATEAAIRIYQTFWNRYDVGTNNTVNHALMKWYHNQFYNDSELKTYIRLLKEKYPEDIIDGAISTDSERKSWLYVNDEGGIDNVTSSMDTKIKELLKLAFAATKKYMDEGAAKLKVEKSITHSAVVAENGVKNYEVKANYKFTAEHFKSHPSISLDFNCKNCTANNVSYRFMVNNQNVDSLLGNLADPNLGYLDENGDGEFTVTIVFTASSANYNCDDIEYDINLKYYDDSISVKAFNMVSSNAIQNGAVQSNYQRFYVMISKNYIHEEKLNDSFSLCSDNGPCDPSTDPECPPDNSTVKCGIKFSYPECTENDTEFEISEGYQIPNNQECKINTNTSTDPNILKCIINNEDIAGNKYLAKNLVSSNKYCSVYCKEDYKFTMPGIKHVNSGRYFHLEANVSGTKSCYTNKIDSTNEFATDLEVARLNVIHSWNDWSKWKNRPTGATSYSDTWPYPSYSDAGRLNENTQATLGDEVMTVEDAKKFLDMAIKAYINVINDYNSCSGIKIKKYKNDMTQTEDNGWEMKYNYEAGMKFWYQEGFRTGVDDLYAGSVVPSAINQGVCSTDVTDSYGCPGHWLETANTRELTQFTCYNGSTRDSYVCGNVEIGVSTAKYVRQIMSVDADYISNTQYYSVAPSGSILFGAPQSLANATELGHLIPVALNRKTGKYNYALYATDLGEFYNNDTLGRIWDGEAAPDQNTVVNAVLTDEACTKPENSALLSSTTINYANDNNNSYSFQNGVYVCEYRVNCPDPSCDVECPNCISITRDREKVYRNFEYRQISTNDFNPNNRELGTNWKTSVPINESNVNITSAVELKAYVTTKEILSDGDSIYDTASTEDNSNVRIKFKVNSKMINAIRNYNKDQKKTGGYLNNSLTCYDYGSYSKIMCYSELIDKLFNDYSERIEINVTRPTGDDARSNYTATGTQGYWTLWDTVVSNPGRWSVTTEQSLSSYQEGYGTTMDIGPSWK